MRLNLGIALHRCLIWVDRSSVAPAGQNLRLVPLTQGWVIEDGYDNRLCEISFDFCTCS